MEDTSVQIYRTIILIIVIATLVMSVTIGTPSAYGLCSGISWHHRIIYHFFHAGLIHWLVNAFALLTIAFRWNLHWWQYVIAFAVASLYPADLLDQDTPIVGLSIWIYSLIGIITPATSYPVRVFFANLICIFVGLLATWTLQCIGSIGIHTSIPIIAWQAHLYAYIAGILIGLCTMPVISINH